MHGFSAAIAKAYRQFTFSLKLQSQYRLGIKPDEL
jgi:hypothetical protein